MGVGLPEVYGHAAVNDSGEWLLFVDTLNPDEDLDVVLLRNGFLTLQEPGAARNAERDGRRVPLPVPRRERGPRLGALCSTPTCRDRTRACTSTRA